MAVRTNYCFVVYICLLSIASVSCWQFFSTLKDIVLSNSYGDTKVTNSEYRFGNCSPKIEQKFYAHVHLDHIDILGKVIVRGWLKINRIPRCILLRAKAYEEDTFRSTSFPFQICVPRITYCHTHRRFKYYYYEWYIPKDYYGGMDWDIYFFGYESLIW